MTFDPQSPKHWADFMPTPLATDADAAASMARAVARAAAPQAYTAQPATAPAAAHAPAAPAMPAAVPTMAAPGWTFSGDQLAHLPEAARETLRELENGATDLHVALTAIAEELRETRLEMQRRAQDMQRIEAGVYFRNDDERAAHPAWAEAKARLDAKQLEVDRLQRRHDAAADRWRPAKRLATNCEEWARALRGRPAMYSGPAPVLRKAETDHQAVSRLRQRLEELNTERERVQAAPYPSELVKARIAADIEQLAERGRPDCFNAIQFNESIRWPTVESVVTNYSDPTPAHITSEQADTLAIFAWIHRDAMIAAVSAEIDRRADDKSALSPQDRAQRLAEIAVEALQIERDECHFARAAGLPIRPDCSPAAVLGLS